MGRNKARISTMDLRAGKIIELVLRVCVSCFAFTRKVSRVPVMDASDWFCVRMSEAIRLQEHALCAVCRKVSVASSTLTLLLQLISITFRVAYIALQMSVACGSVAYL